MDVKTSEWNGFKRIDFVFEDRDAILVFPNDSNKTDKWMLKTEYFGAYPTLEIELLKRGYHLAYVTNINRWGLTEDLSLKKRFADFLTSEFGLNEKCVPIGMSCGGLFGIKFAGMYPEKVSVLYIDAPVVNILSLLGMGTGEDNIDVQPSEIYNALKTTRSEMISYREHPLDYLPNVIKNKIPACLVYGNADEIVIPSENCELVKKAYTGRDIPFIWFEKDGVGHHPHALEELTETEQKAVIDFIINNDK